MQCPAHVAPPPLVPLRALRASGSPPLEATAWPIVVGRPVARRLRSRARSVRPAAAALQAGELPWREHESARGWEEARLMDEHIDRGRAADRAARSAVRSNWPRGQLVVRACYVVMCIPSFTSTVNIEHHRSREV